MIPNPMRLTRIVRKMMSSGRVTTVANILQSRASHERHLRRCARRGGRAGGAAGAAARRGARGARHGRAGGAHSDQRARCGHRDRQRRSHHVSEGHRRRERRDGQPVTPDMLFRVGPAVTLSMTPIAMEAAEMAKYAGSYTNPPARIDVTVREGKLYFRRGAQEAEATKVGDLRFAGADSADRVPAHGQ